MKLFAPLWEKLKKILGKSPEASGLTGKANDLARIVEADIEAYVAQKKKLDAIRGYQRGMAGRELSVLGRQMRGHVVELSRLFDEIKDEEFLKGMANWRSDVEALLNGKLKQQIRLAAGHRVVARYLQSLL